MMDAPRRWGFLVQPGALWVGAHYSAHHKRWCINILPCLTLWVCLPGGIAPHSCRVRYPATTTQGEIA